MASKQMTAAEIRAKKRRERILKAGDSRMKMVSGELLKQTFTDASSIVEEKSKNEDEHINKKESEDKEKPMSWEEKRKKAVEKAKKRTEGEENVILDRIDSINENIEQVENEPTRVKPSRTPRDFESPKVKETKSIRVAVLKAQRKVAARNAFGMLRFFTCVFLGAFLAYYALHVPERRINKTNIRLGRTLMEQFYSTKFPDPEFIDDTEVILETDPKAKKFNSLYEARVQGFTFYNMIFESEHYNYLPLGAFVVLNDLILLGTLKFIYRDVSPTLIKSDNQSRGFIMQTIVSFGGQPLEKALLALDFIHLLIADGLLAFMVFVLSVAAYTISLHNAILQSI